MQKNYQEEGWVHQENLQFMLPKELLLMSWKVAQKPRPRKTTDVVQNKELARRLAVERALTCRRVAV